MQDFANSTVNLPSVVTFPNSEKSKILRVFDKQDEFSQIRRVNSPLESECCLFTILEDGRIINMDIKAIVYSKHKKYIQNITPNDPIVIFSCFDEVHIIFTPKQNTKKQALANNTLDKNIEKTISTRSNNLKIENSFEESDVNLNINDMVATNSDHYNFSKNLKEEAESTLNSTEYNNDTAYYSIVKCCGNWNMNSIQCFAIDRIAGITDRLINVQISISNKKPQGRYHLNLCKSNKTEEKQTILFCNKKLFLFKYQCPICFLTHRFIDHYILHMKAVHPSFYLVNKDKEIEIGVKNINYEASPISIFRSGNFIDLILRYEEGIEFREDLNKNIDGIDFCQGISVETTDIDGFSNNSLNNYQMYAYNHTLRRNWKLNFNSLEKSKTKNNSDLGQVIVLRAATAVELVKKLNSFDSSICDFIRVAFIDPFRVSSNYPNKKFEGQNKSFITLLVQQKILKELKDFSKRDISFIRKASSPLKKTLFNYPLFNYGLLIEREYDIFDYTDLLANHMNQRLDLELKTRSITEKEHDLMTYWNILMSKYKNIDSSLEQLLNTRGLTENVINFLGLLYRRGILNSSELIDQILRSN